MEIKSHTFLVTGGASGLGAACARLLATLAGYVVIADLNDATGEQFAGELGPAARFAKSDVTNAEHVQAAIGVATSQFGRGFGTGRSTAAASSGRGGSSAKMARTIWRLFERIVRINLIGTFNVLRLAAAAMQRRAIHRGPTANAA